MASPSLATGLMIVALVAAGCSAAPSSSSASDRNAFEIPAGAERSDPIRPNESDAPYDLSGGATSGSA
ncbi:MAG: hypothetical protein ACR2NL_11025, partial [Acidimicrobiia bacterium]